MLAKPWKRKGAPNGKEVRKGDVAMDSPPREDEHTAGRRTLQAVALAGSPSYGDIP